MQDFCQHYLEMERLKVIFFFLKIDQKYGERHFVYITILHMASVCVTIWSKLAKENNSSILMHMQYRASHEKWVTLSVPFRVLIYLS